jgi:hypothetical protein
MEATLVLSQNDTRHPVAASNVYFQESTDRDFGARDCSAMAMRTLRERVRFRNGDIGTDGSRFLGQDCIASV